MASHVTCCGNDLNTSTSPRRATFVWTTLETVEAKERVNGLHRVVVSDGTRVPTAAAASATRVTRRIPTESPTGPLLTVMSARPQGTRTPAKGTFSRVHKGMVRAALPPERAREGVPNPIIPTWPHSGPAGEAPRASPGDITDILNSAFEILSQHGPGAGRGACVQLRFLVFRPSARWEHTVFLSFLGCLRWCTCIFVCDTACCPCTDLRRTRIVPTEPTRFSLSDSGRLGYASRSPMPYTVLGKEAERSPTYMHSTQSRVGLDFIRPDSRSPDVSATAHRRTRSPTQSRSKSKSKTESRSPPVCAPPFVRCVVFSSVDVTPATPCPVTTALQEHSTA